NYPAPLRSASLHQQQRNEIMEIGRHVVNPPCANIFKKLRGAGTVPLTAPGKCLGIRLNFDR
ncbi:hypothetical protein P0D75_27490, partial [Paraburkholderia sediminicola]|uniref:hypothetical protein n=1 Tax=Paraburkholderia sediminicola TaxID=458836 RepID=UPI0038BC4CBE